MGREFRALAGSVRLCASVRLCRALASRQHDRLPAPSHHDPPDLRAPAGCRRVRHRATVSPPGGLRPGAGPGPRALAPAPGPGRRLRDGPLLGGAAGPRPGGHRGGRLPSHAPPGADGGGTSATSRPRPRTCRCSTAASTSIVACGSLDWVDRGRFLPRAAELLTTGGWLIPLDFGDAGRSADVPDLEGWHRQVFQATLSRSPSSRDPMVTAEEASRFGFGGPAEPPVRDRVLLHRLAVRRLPDDRVQRDRGRRVRGAVRRGDPRLARGRARRPVPGQRRAG